jgi:hypothetical protein
VLCNTSHVHCFYLTCALCSCEYVRKYCIVYIQHTYSYLVACMYVCCDTAHVQQSMAYALSGPTHVQHGNTHVEHGTTHVQYGHVHVHTINNSRYRGYCIAGVCIGYIRLPQSQKTVCIFKQGVLLFFVGKEISSSALGRPDDPSRVPS